jgi:hypothetical protein
VTRHNYLSVTELPLLRAWGHEVKLMFGEMPYQVGSSLTRRGWRDVDVRLMLDMEKYDSLLASGIDIYYLNLSVSLWGQRMTGLPIDFQVQDAFSADIDYDGERRDPCGINPKALQDSRVARHWQCYWSDAPHVGPPCSAEEPHDHEECGWVEGPRRPPYVVKSAT